MFKGKFCFETTIDKPLNEVWAFFSKNTNLAEITGFPKVKVTGDQEVSKGARVNLELNFVVLTLTWKARIIDEKEGAFFTDVAEKAPFPFRIWTHTHRFVSEGSKTKMVDEVEFSSWIPAPIIKLMLYGMFFDRKKQIKKHEPL
ncbi:SRPBCC family protein [Alteribacter keqinensis]|uniref:Cyclase n=1 Tax=Alteribacter keqinensis TaxID=2483800 RepID=A0A3M7TVL1_9BACI|nr:hypothetical protein [Alteribacter keqinensis]RNA69022.1 hypothetical protein EBO34_03440 [Alteribacter keqinensis]